MKLTRCGANRYSGDTIVFDKAPAVSWSATKSGLQFEVKRVSLDNGQFNFTVTLSVEDILKALGALSKEAKLPAIADGLAPALRDLHRLQAVAAGVAVQ